MKLITILLLVALFPVQDPATPEFCPQWPLKSGSSWQYRIEGTEVLLTMKVTKYEKVGDVLCSRLETLRDGKVVAFEHLAATAEGLYRHAYGDARIEPPLLLFKRPPKVGQTWKFESKMSGITMKGEFTMGREEIEVAAGKFTAWSAGSEAFEAGDQKFGSTIWLADDVGMVRQKLTINGVVTLVNLEKHEAGK